MTAQPLRIVLLTLLATTACRGESVTSAPATDVPSRPQAAVSANGGNVRASFSMNPPPAGLFPDALATGYLYGAFLQGDHPKWGPGASLDIRMHSVPCPSFGWGQTAADIQVASRRFYAVYASTATNGWVRLMSFTPNCLGENETIAAALPIDLDWFTEEITVEIRLETDDGDDGGPLILVGTVTATG